MKSAGANRPAFQEVQIDLAAHIRNPRENPGPEGLEARRLRIYAQLFYNNIEHFLASTFPVARRIHLDPSWPGIAWEDLVRAFVHQHGCESPYFLEISQEFLQFASGFDACRRWPWLLELLHYEWVEMALSVSEAEVPPPLPQTEAALLDTLAVSPVARALTYRYPVQTIGPGHLPAQEPEEATYLVVYRRRDDSVHFMAANPLTLRLLALLGEGLSGRAALEQLATELGLSPSVVADQGLATLRRLADLDILAAR
ncbi:MAG: putative DNA-binding domain-containing protein [Pseudomonadales bacterium]